MVSVFFGGCGSDSPVQSDLNPFAASFETSKPSNSPNQPPIMNPYAVEFEPRRPETQASSSVLNAFAMSFEPQDEKEEAEGPLLNAFAMSFEPSSEEPSQETLNPFAMSFSPPVFGKNPVAEPNQEQPNAPEELAEASPQILSSLPILLPSRLLEDLGHAKTSSKKPKKAAKPQMPATVWPQGAATEKELPAWLQAVWEPRKRSISGSASPVSTQIDDEGGSCCAGDDQSGWCSAGSDTDSPAEAPARRPQPPVDVGHQKGKEILNLLKDFEPGQQDFSGPGRQFVQELEKRNDLLIHELRRRKAELLGAQQRCPAEALQWQNNAKSDQTWSSAAPNHARGTGKFRAVNWQRLARDAEAANTALLTHLRRTSAEVSASQGGVSYTL